VPRGNRTKGQSVDGKRSPSRSRRNTIPPSWPNSSRSSMRPCWQKKEKKCNVGSVSGLLRNRLLPSAPPATRKLVQYERFIPNVGTK